MRSCHSCWRTLLLVSLALVVFFGCAKDDDDGPTNSTPSASLWVVMGDDSSEVMYADLPTFRVDGQDVIQLSDFVSQGLIEPWVDRDDVEWDTRPLYSYQIIGVDGFSASGNRGYLNNHWAHLEAGYIVVATTGANFPSDLNLPGAYNVDSVGSIAVHRKLDLITPDTTSLWEFKDVVAVEVTNHDGNPEMALPLMDFVDPEIITDPSLYVYNIAALDGFGPGEDMTWEQFQTGYWLLDTGKTLFEHEDLVGGAYKLQVLEKITVAAAPAP